MQRLFTFRRVKVFLKGKFNDGHSLNANVYKLHQTQLMNHFSISHRKWVDKRLLCTYGPTVDHNNIFTSPFPDVEIPSDYVHQIVWKNVDNWRNKTAVVCAASGKWYTYEILRKLSGRLATSLRRSNLRYGDTLAIALPNIPEYAIIALGVSEAGLKMTLLNSAYTAHEMGVQIVNSDATAIITTPEIYPVIGKVIKERNLIQLPIIVVSTGSESRPASAIDFNDLISDGVDEFKNTDNQSVNVNQNDTFILPYSSGTTGLPKGVEITHRNIVANFIQGEHRAYHHDEPAIGEHQEIVPAFLPFYHIFGFVICLLNYLRMGGKVICMPRFTANNLLDVLKENKTTALYVVPPVIQLMVNDDRFIKEYVESVKNVVSGAAPLGGELINKFHSKMQVKVTQGYGLTETSPLVARAKHSDWNSAGLITINTKIRIVDSDNDNLRINLGTNKIGEIYVKGPQVMAGYYKNKKATDDCMDGEWFKTGDLGYVDDKESGRDQMSISKPLSDCH
ncbi:uncharacterized protein LOC135168006 isoform X2 [Diachasmimorpha longicaudata]|uniref:uncharacterized protein LOC135168006 isoform X2 n=1 Tax=Diachasmimorpha longicaudata TaxID=58733 RepID=UPI0030B91615